MSRRQESIPTRRPAGAVHIVGECPGMVGVRRWIQQLGPTSLSLLITGETGTGKELVVRSLHAVSGRHGPLVTVNCSSFPESLIESELFGHRRGAFTGALHDKKGLIQSAAGGTLFLDEIGDLPRTLQPKLLRAVELGEVRPVGSTTTEFVDVRVLAATNREMARELADGTFRQDLYRRLRQDEIHLPPLRERGSDVELLAHYFLLLMRESNHASHITRDVAEALTSYSWPGNVRELRSVIQRGLAMASRGEQIRLEHLPSEIGSPLRDGGGRSRVLAPIAWPTEIWPLKEIVTAYVRHAYEINGQHHRRTAELLGIDVKTLGAKLSGREER